MTIELDEIVIQPSLAPPYRQIEADIRRQVRDGHWPAGSMVPSRRDLARRYGVDVNTIQRAMGILLKDGILRAEGWRGTFVADSTTATISRNRPERLYQPVQRIATPRHTTRVSIGIVASVIPDVLRGVPPGDHWQAIVVHALERSISEEAASTVHFQNRWADDRPGETMANVDAAKRLLADGVDGVVVMFPYHEEVNEYLAFAESNRVPSVIVTPAYEIAGIVPHVRYDSANAGYVAADHLLRQGYRRLGFFAPFRSTWSDERLNGVREAVRREYSRRASDAYLNKIDKLRVGIVAANDHAALGLLQGAEQRALVAGRDFGLVGFDDIPQSREVGLTSLRPPLEAMGAEAGRVIRQVVTGVKAPAQVVLQSQIVSRKSSLFAGPKSVSGGS